MIKYLLSIAVAALFLFAGLPASAAGLTISYSLSKPSKVSVNIYGADGQVVRELMHAVPRAAGKNSDTWDGLNDQGTPAPTGDYTWKLLATPGLKAQYLMSLGNNYPNDPNDWRGRAPGTHGGPIAVAADSTGIYSAASGTENIENYLVKMDPTGKTRLWTQMVPVAWNAATAMAVDSGTLYVLAPNGDIRPYDAKTGVLGTVLKLPIDDEIPTSLAARAGVLALVYPKHGIVAWADPVKGVLTDRVEIKDVTDVAITGDGDLLALTASTVTKIARADKTQVPLIQGLESAARLDIDSSTGDILIAQTGDCQQVRRFSAAGAAKQTYGRLGGREDGVYRPENFRDVGDIACDGSGGFFVSEPNAAPRRTAHFDASGKLIHEWYGGQSWGSWVFPEPDNPNAVWMNSSWSDMMRLVLDYKTNTWQVQSVYHYQGMADNFIGWHVNGDLWEGRVHNGTLYLCRSVGDPCIIRVDRKAWKLYPCVEAFDHVKFYKADVLPKMIADLRGDNDACLWTDANGDGIPQPSELTWNATQGSWHGLPGVQANMSYVFDDATKTICQYSVSRWNSAGSPVYAGFPVGEKIVAAPARATSIEGRWGGYYAHDDASGDLYAAFNDRMPDWGQSRDSFVTKWDHTGKQEWTVGHLGLGPGVIYPALPDNDPMFNQPSHVGYIWRPFRRLMGMTHGCPVFDGFSYEWSGDGPTATYVWDKDGLWVGSVFDNIDLTAADENEYSLGAEGLSATLWTNPSNGSVLLFGCWLNEARVYRITGWDGWVRDTGKLTVTSANAAGASTVWNDPVPLELPAANGTGLKGEYYASDRYDPAALKMTRIDPSIDFFWGNLYKPDYNSIPEIGKGAPFSIHWTGKLVPRRTGLYAFRSNYWSIGKIEVAGSEFRDPGADRVKGRYRVYLEAGHPYDFEVKYTVYGSHPLAIQGVKVEWMQPDSVDWEKVPTSQLFPSCYRSHFAAEAIETPRAILQQYDYIEDNLN